VDRLEDARLTRRRFVAAGLAAAGGLLLPGCGTRTGARISNEQFLAVSRLLTGERNLPEQLGPTYLELIEDAGMPVAQLVRTGYGSGITPQTLADLQATGALDKSRAHACARAIAAAWWSGMAPTSAGDSVVVSYADALIWRYAHPPSTCEGTTGVWAEPPAKLAA
jgi:hypothetical protein